MQNFDFIDGVTLKGRPGLKGLLAIPSVFTELYGQSADIINIIPYQRDNGTYALVRAYDDAAGHWIEYEIRLSNSVLLSGAVRWEQSTINGVALGAIAAPYELEAVIYQDNLYLVDGELANQRWDVSADSLKLMGIAAPTVAPTGAPAAGAGVPAGLYYYYYSFYNSTIGIESALSPASTVITVVVGANQKVTLSNVPVSTDDQVTKRYIYRQGTGSDVIFYVGAIADNTTTTFDDTEDAPTEAEDCDTNDPLNTVSLLTEHNNQMFAAGRTSYLGYLYDSRFYMPHAWPALFFTLIQAGQTIVQIRSLNIDLIIYTTRSIFRYRSIGLTENDVVLEKIIDVALLNKRTLVDGLSQDNKACHIFVGKSNLGTGIFMFDGTSALKLTDKIDPLFTGENSSITKMFIGDTKTLYATYNNNKYYLVYNTTASYSSNILVMDLSNNNVRFNKIVLSDATIRCISSVIFKDQTTGQYLDYLLAGYTDESGESDVQYVGHFTNTYTAVHNVSGITYIAQTGYFGDMNVISTAKSLTFNANTSSETLTVKIYEDYTLKDTQTCSTSSMARVALNLSNLCFGKLHSIRFEITTTKAIQIMGPIKLKVSPWKEF